MRLSKRDMCARVCVCVCVCARVCVFVCVCVCVCVGCCVPPSLSFNHNSSLLACSSDKGTIHIFKLKREVHDDSVPAPAYAGGSAAAAVGGAGAATPGHDASVDVDSELSRYTCLRSYMIRFAPGKVPVLFTPRELLGQTSNHRAAQVRG